MAWEIKMTLTGQVLLIVPEAPTLAATPMGSCYGWSVFFSSEFPLNKLAVIAELKMLPLNPGII